MSWTCLTVVSVFLFLTHNTALNLKNFGKKMLLLTLCFFFIPTLFHVLISVVNPSLNFHEHQIRTLENASYPCSCNKIISVQMAECPWRECRLGKDQEYEMFCWTHVVCVCMKLWMLMWTREEWRLLLPPICHYHQCTSWSVWETLVSLLMEVRTKTGSNHTGTIWCSLIFS